MPLYETTLVIDSLLEESALTARVQKYVDLVTQAGAVDLQVDRRGIRKLAYNIKGKDGQWRTQADYSFVFYEAPGTAVNTLETQLRLDEDILRTMTVRYDRMPPASPVDLNAIEAAENSRDDDDVRGGRRSDRDMDMDASNDEAEG
jgi:small subunit ribosomal protein S6